MNLRKIGRLIFTLIIIIGVICGIVIGIKGGNSNKKEEVIVNKVFKDIQSVELELNNIYSYGKGFNLAGSINYMEPDTFENIKLLITDGKEYEKAINLNSFIDKKQKKLYFSTDNNMNRGLVIDDLSVGNYYLIIRLKSNNSVNPKYYTLTASDELKDSDINYYTVTKDEKNRKLDISFGMMKYKNKDMSFMKLIISDAELPDDVYDIVIDAGHGGKDQGEVRNGLNEADITLKYSLKLKEKLDELGYKVKLTRTEENTDSYTYTNMYDSNGRITIAGDTKAKLMLSFHVNYDKNASLRGIEIYSPPKSNLDFAGALAKGIVENSSLEFSNNNTAKRKDGVYVKNFDSKLIKGFAAKANREGYEPYNINVDTPYLYTIREVGGVATNAYVDGRNKNYSANRYYNSHHGIECYQLEMGYIKTDADILKGEIDAIVESIAKTIDEAY